MPQVTPPYHFVPVVPELAVHDTPVFHDVQKTGDDWWSGELQCELEALTPLIAGHYQFEFQHATPAIKDAFRKLARDRTATGTVDDKRLCRIYFRDLLGAIV